MKRKIITIAVSVFLALSCQTGMIANASNYSHIIDNDPIASGFGYTYTSNMTYYSASGSYDLIGKCVPCCGLMRSSFRIGAFLVSDYRFPCCGLVRSKGGNNHENRISQQLI